jgi:hypothetical protein
VTVVAEDRARKSAKIEIVAAAAISRKCCKQQTKKEALR